MQRVAIARTSLVHNKTPLAPYLQSLLDKYGGLEWALNDVAGKPYCDVINNAVALGRELVINGGFDADATWSKGAGWTISGGAAHASNATADLTQALGAAIVVGRFYTVTYTILNYSSGNVTAYIGATGSSTTRSGNGTFTETIKAITTTTIGFQRGGTTPTFDIDNVSVKELNIPAYNAVPVQILNTDVWNGAGVGAWTALNSAILSAQTTTRHDGVSGTVLRVARGVVPPGGATRTVMTVGLVYRAYGWTRSDGTCSPVVRHGSTTVFTGTTSTSWQPFDVVFVAASTDIQLNTLNGANTNYVEFDVTVVALDTGIRTDSPGNDLNMENNDILSWTVQNANVTVTKATSSPHSGSRNLRITTIATNIGVSQGCLCAGHAYLVSGWYRTDGTANFRVTAQGSGTTLSNPAVWTAFSVYLPPSAVTNTLLFFQVFTSTGWAEVDDVVIQELSPLVAVPSATVTLGVTENNRLLNSASLNGSNSVINLYSAQLNSISPVDEATLIFFVKVSGSGIWTNGIAARLISYRVDANNTITIDKTGSNNTLLFSYIAGGTTVSVTASSQSSTGWLQVAITLSKSGNAMKAFINGSQVGLTQTGQGAWVGNLVSTTVTLGAGNTGASSPFSGFESHLILLPVALSASEVLESSILGDCA